MSAKASLLHRIKVNRRMRKVEEDLLIHPALKSDWEFLNREQQSDKLLLWKMKMNQRSITR